MKKKANSEDDYILGVKLILTPHGFALRHDESATICKNGKIIAGVEQERFDRIKHSDNFPREAINFCLNEAGVDLNRTVLAVPATPHRFETNWKNKVKNGDIFGALLFTGTILRKKLLSYDDYIAGYLKKQFGEAPKEIEYVEHHLCHASSAFYPSGFDRATIITADNMGDGKSTVVWKGEGEKIEEIDFYSNHKSLGAFYGLITKFLGWRQGNGEGKTMGLAPYGFPNEDIREKLENIVSSRSDGYEMSNIRDLDLEKLEEILGFSRRIRDEELTQNHKDLAYEAQKILEKIVKNLVKSAIRKTGENKICLAGGVSLNCKMNKEIRELKEVEDIFIQPIEGDCGLSVGAALEASRRRGHEVKFNMTHPFFGPSYSDAEIENLLNKIKVSYENPDNIAKKGAKYLAEGKLIGWFQGKLEMGPRALGHRSILAEPTKPETRDKINRFAKHRQEWRPFAPSILEEFAEDYFENGTTSPFMIDTFDVKEEKLEDMKAVIHPGDNSARPQTVSKEVAPRYYKLIEEFRKITGVPVVLNTSFNDRGEPIVNRPIEAVRDFFGMGLDVLVIGDYMVRKPSMEVK